MTVKKKAVRKSKPGLKRVHQKEVIEGEPELFKLEQVPILGKSSSQEAARQRDKALSIARKQQVGWSFIVERRYSTNIMKALREKYESRIYRSSTIYPAKKFARIYRIS